ncbi:unnamed protein product [Somion occarium]
MSSSKELAKVIVRQEGEVKDLRNRLYILTERLKDETQRADDAEKRTMDAVLKFKEVNDARLAAQQESTRLTEELRLYKLQLDNAQKEILKAQEVLDSLEAQRNDAEEAAARARSTARKLKEEKIVLLAREEGRLQGFKEGVAQGRAIGYEEGRNAGYGRSRATPPSRESSQNPIMLPASPPRGPSPSSSSYSDSPPPRPLAPAFEGSPPEDIHIRSSPASSGPLNMKNTEMHPVTVHNVSVDPPSNAPVEYPPEGWIPTIDDDGRVRLPPPHELAPAPPTPKGSPSASATLKMTEELDGPMKMIPPPFQTPMNANVTLSDIESRATTPAARRPKHKRRNSEESMSTTISQFEIVGLPPVSSSARNLVERPNVLSAIVEEKERSSSMSSPQGGGSSPYHNGSSPSMMQRPEGQTPQVIHAGLTNRQSHENLYVRPRSHSSLSDAGLVNPPRSPPSRSQSQSRLSRKGSVSSDVGIAINVEPPSRPDSNQSGASGTQQHPNLLSASDAEAIAPAGEATSQANIRPTTGTSPLTAFPSMPIDVLANSELPPGFMPMGPPIPVDTAMGPASAIYANPMTPAAIPLPPSSAPSIHRLNSGTTPSVAGSVLPGTFPGGTADPVVIPLPSSSVLSHAGLQSEPYSRAALHKDSSSDDEISSSLSDSMDSLTTPPQRYRKTPGPTYATAPTPPDLVYPLPVVPPTPSRSLSSRSGVSGSISAAAKVPLPSSTVGGSPKSTYTRLSKRSGSGSGSQRA